MMKRANRCMWVCALTAVSLCVFPGTLQADDGGAIPALYDTYVKDQRINRTLMEALRWSTVSVVATGVCWALKSTNDPASGQGYEDALIMVASGMLAGTAGFVGGGVYGFLDGVAMNRERTEGKLDVRGRYRTGYEITMGMCDYPGFRISHRLGNTAPIVPDKFSIGVHQDVRRGAGRKDGEYSIACGTHELKLETAVRYELHRKGIVLPYFGIGTGYSMAESYTEYWGPDKSYPEYRIPYDRTTKKVETAFVNVAAGIELNVIDYFYGRIEANFEPYGVLDVVQDYDRYDLTDRFIVRAAVGTYLF